MKIINPKTGEIVTNESERLVIVDAYKEYKLKIKELEQVTEALEELLQPHIDLAMANGEKELGAFTIVFGARRFSVDLFNEAAPSFTKEQRATLKEQIAEIEAQFKAPSKPYLKFKQII